MFHDIRRASVYLELHELIRYIYDRTGYYDYVQALPGGERRKANLDLLRERAVAYAAGSYSSLFDFMRYIEQLKKNQIDFGEAVMPENDKGRVRIMSIHKSKGLEYPIVILAGLGKKFNFQDSISKLVMHAKSGIGLDAVNLQTRKKMTSAYKKFIAARLNLETLAEEQRILYVAMTRAKEKLIMTGMESLKNTDKKLEIWQRNSGILGEVFPDWMLTSARSYLDWIMPAVMNGEAENVVTLRMVDIRALAGREVGRVIDKKWQKDNSWGDYFVKTTAAYDGKADLQNALIYSDNTYFAKVALKMGIKTYTDKLNSYGFNDQMDFPFTIPASSYGEESDLKKDITLADTGYGQGKLQISPLHLTAFYASFENNGSIPKPYLIYQDGKAETWKKDAISSGTVETLKKALTNTYHSYDSENPTKALGKTGTAQVNEKEIGWLCSANEDYAITLMVDNAEDRNGSLYVTPLMKALWRTLQ